MYECIRRFCKKNFIFGNCGLCYIFGGETQEFIYLAINL
jgi:hypothetical protein